MFKLSILFLSALALIISGCASIPSEPSVMVLPGHGQSFEQFRYDDAFCRQFAYAQVGGTAANQSAVNSGIISAAVGTAIGAAAGAAIGGGEGAAIGAGSGLAAGSLVGAGLASEAMSATQKNYDNAYIQCMYTKGHQVPVSKQFFNAMQDQSGTQRKHIPPPPPGAPPPPPPGY
ncbi:MAG: hypothetical protein K9L22_06070 [Methylococcaceae bacterium]|nr:hypothetical protein [Methylococcaceae bacterium]